MIKKILALMVALASFAFAQSVTVQDNWYTPATGQLTVTWPAFILKGVGVSAGSVSAQVNQGFFTIRVWPSDIALIDDGLTVGFAYTVTLTTAAGVVTDSWVVPYAVNGTRVLLSAVHQLPGGSGGTGTVTVSGSPLIHQIPIWTSGTNLKGITVGVNNTVLKGSTGADAAFGALAKADLPATTLYNDAANTAGVAMTLDMSAVTAAAAFRIPNKAGAAPTVAGVFEYDTINKNIHAGANSVDNLLGMFLASALPADLDCIKASVSSSVVRLLSAGSPCVTTGSLPSLLNGSYVTTTTAEVLQSGARKTFTQSSTLGAISIAGANLGSHIIHAGDILMDLASKIYTDDGTNVNTIIQFPGSGAAPAYPTLGVGHFAGSTDKITSSPVVSGDMAVVNTRQVCDIAIGDTSGSTLTTGQLGPQKRLCYIPAAATIVEVDVSADAGTPSIIIGRNVAGTQANILSGALSTAASGGIACSKTSAITGIDGATTCSATLQNTSLAAGSYLEAVSGSVSTAKLFTAHVIYVIN